VTEPGLVALYDTRPGNGAGLFLQPRSPHGAWAWMNGVENMAATRVECVFCRSAEAEIARCDIGRRWSVR